MWLPILLGVLALVACTVIYIVVTARRHGPAIQAAQRALFAATGYRHPEAPAASLDEAVAFVPRGRVDLRTGGFATRYVAARPDGEAVRFEQLVTSERGKRVRRQHWAHTLGRAPRVRVQIAERALASSGRGVRAVLTGVERTWHPIYPHPVALGDAALDGRFVVLSDDPAAARAALLASPGLLARLAALPEVDVRVTDHEVRLDDPGDRCLRAARDDAGGRAATLANPAVAIEASIPVHQQVGALLDQLRAAVA